MNNLSVDIKDLKSMINQLQTSDLYKIERTALRKSARILYDNAKTGLLNKVPKPTQLNPKYSDTLADALRMSIHQDNTNNFYFTVHIMGTRKKGSGTFRTRFFESGTAPRKTRKGYNRGSLKATNFFADAVNGSESSVIKAIEENFITEFNKYWR